MHVEGIFHRTVECGCKCNFSRCECNYFHESRATTIEAQCRWDERMGCPKFTDCLAFDAETGEEVDIKAMLEIDKERARNALRNEGNTHIGALLLEFELFGIERRGEINA